MKFNMIFQYMHALYAVYSEISQCLTSRYINRKSTLR